VSKARILIVEDESIVVLDLEHRLGHLGYAVCAVAASGAEAIQKAAASRPDLVLMDIRLRGEMDGIEAAKTIGARFDIPVVYLTALADRDTLQRAEATAPYGYIHKPFDDNELYKVIEAALQQHKGREQGAKA
jgi:CheY-like chemotaxis protein